MANEIGGEFWATEIGTQDISLGYCWFLSGRTSLEFIIQDILSDRNVKRVYLPSYCCDSIIEPFLRHQIEVSFYDVIIGAQGIIECVVDKKVDCDIFVAINYFGYMPLNMEAQYKYYRECGATIIEDTTHSFFNNNIKTETMADYIFGSIRKWTGAASGGYAKKMFDQLKLPLPTKYNVSFVNCRVEAQNEKEKYIELQQVSKDRYLKLFSEAEAALENDYIDYAIDVFSESQLQAMNTEYIKSRRLMNSNVICRMLQSQNNCKPIVPQDPLDNTPLFVPIYLNEDRDLIKQEMIQRHIYLPTHWPLTELHRINIDAKEIYHHELSIVCDQRYTERNIQQMMKVLIGVITNEH